MSTLEHISESELWVKIWSEEIQYKKITVETEKLKKALEMAYILGKKSATNN